MKLLFDREREREREDRVSADERTGKRRREPEPEDTGIRGEPSNGDAHMLINLEHLLLVRGQLRGRALGKEGDFEILGIEILRIEN